MQHTPEDTDIEEDQETLHDTPLPQIEAIEPTQEYMTLEALGVQATEGSSLADNLNPPSNTHGDMDKLLCSRRACRRDLPLVRAHVP